MFAVCNTNMYITRYILVLDISFQQLGDNVSWGVSVDPSVAGLGNVHSVIFDIYQLNCNFSGCLCALRAQGWGTFIL